jgi:hypothetical protein
MADLHEASSFFGDNVATPIDSTESTDSTESISATAESNMIGITRRALDMAKHHFNKQICLVECELKSYPDVSVNVINLAKEIGMCEELLKSIQNDLEESQKNVISQDAHTSEHFMKEQTECALRLCIRLKREKIDTLRHELQTLAAQCTNQLHFDKVVKLATKIVSYTEMLA